MGYRNYGVDGVVWTGFGRILMFGLFVFGSCLSVCLFVCFCQGHCVPRTLHIPSDLTKWGPVREDDAVICCYLLLLVVTWRFPGNGVIQFYCFQFEWW